jgi:GrpB-like predicted nucleotidyltransferase (UPF0157 family)
MPFLSAPDSSWPGSYAAVEAELATALGQWQPRIEHIGSTSVPDLHAKPLIDVVVGLPGDAVDDPGLRKALDGMGYRQASHQASLGRRIFVRRGSAPSVNAHVVPYGGEAWTQLLLTRDLLREDPEVAASYVAMKQQADKESGGDYRKYRARKEAWFAERTPRLETFHRSRSDRPLDLAALNAGVAYGDTPVSPQTGGVIVPLEGPPGSQTNPIAGPGVATEPIGGGNVEYHAAEGGLVQEFRDADGNYRVDVVSGGSGSPSPS